MDVVVALHAAAAVLVVVAGLAKLARPAPTVALFTTLGVPGRTLTAVGVGLAETALGVLALAAGGPGFAAVVALLYVGFAAVVVRALRVGASSCGCFGRVDAPPSWLHVVGNLVFAALSAVAVAGDTPVEVLDRQPAGGIGFVVLVGVIAGLALVAFTALPEALSARHRSTPTTFRVSPREGAGR